MDIRVNATHHVVHYRSHWDQLGHGVDVLVVAAQLAHERQLCVDQVGAEVSQVEVDDGSIRGVDGPSLFLLVHERLGHPVPGPELHAAQLWLRRGFAEVVVLQVAVAVFVQQPTTLRSRGLGDQDSGERQSGGVVLDEFHVFQRRARPESEGHPVSGLDVRVGGEWKHAPASAGAHDHRVGEDCFDAPRRQLDGDEPRTRPSSTSRVVTNHSS